MNNENNQNYNNMQGNNNLFNREQMQMSQNVNYQQSSDVNGNYQNVNKVRTNKNRKLLIILVSSVLVVIAGIVVFKFINLKNDEGGKDNNIVNDNIDDVVKEWINYDEIEKYEFAKMVPLNLNDIEVVPQKITFVSSGGKKSTLDFSGGDYFPNYLENNGFRGMIYMSLYDEFISKNYEGYKESDSSIFNNLLKDGMSIKFYSVDKSQAYANCVVQIGDCYWNIGINIESRSVEEAVKYFKTLISLISNYDENAVTSEEFLHNFVRKIKFNVSNISLDDVELFGTGFMFNKSSDKIKISQYGADFYSSYFYAKNGNILLDLCRDFSTSLKDGAVVKKLSINGNKVRIYRYGDDKRDFRYYVGVIFENKEYVHMVSDISREKENTEKELIELLNKIIK